MILITGGRGRIARRAVAQLRATGQPLRVASRQPAEFNLPSDVEVVEADLAQATGWSRALEGVTGVLLYADPSGVESFVAAARSAGDVHIALLSAAAAANEAAADADPIVRMHQAAEDAVRGSGLPWTFLRPGGLATNALHWAESIRTERAVRAPYPEAHSAPIHEADIAAIAALVLSEPEGGSHQGSSYELTGPESLTQRDQVEQIGAAIGEEVAFEEITPEAYRDTLSQWGDEEMVDTLVEHLGAANGRPAAVSSTVEALIGRPATPFARWANDHADDFR